MLEDLEMREKFTSLRYQLNFLAEAKAMLNKINLKLSHQLNNVYIFGNKRSRN